MTGSDHGPELGNEFCNAELVQADPFRLRFGEKGGMDGARQPHADGTVGRGNHFHETFEARLGQGIQQRKDLFVLLRAAECPYSLTTAVTCRAGCKERGVSKNRNAGPVNAWCGASADRSCVWTFGLPL